MMPDYRTNGNAEQQQTRSEAVWVTPEMARHLRDTCHFERQRTLRHENISRLAYEMRQGWFIPGTQIYLAVLPDGGKLILNGNHTLEAVAKAERPILLTMTYCAVGDIEEAARIYANFDNQRTRGWDVRLKAVGADEVVKMAVKVSPAIGIIAAGFSSNPVRSTGGVSTRGRVAAMLEYADAAALVHGAIAGGARHVCRMLMRAPVLAVALYTARHQPTAAEAFWSACAKEDQPVGHPSRSLIRALSNISGVGSALWQTQIRATALCWNAFFEGRSLEVVRPHAMTTLRILGTDWHKGDPILVAPQRRDAAGSVSENRLAG